MADATTTAPAPSKMTMSERRAMGLRQLAESVRPDDDVESPSALPLSGYICGCCATPLPVGVLDCPHCHTAVADTTPRPNHPAGSRLAPTTQTIDLDEQASAARTRDIRRNWLRRPERSSVTD